MGDENSHELYRERFNTLMPPSSIMAADASIGCGLKRAAIDYGSRQLVLVASKIVQQPTRIFNRPGIDLQRLALHIGSFAKTDNFVRTETTQTWL
jgi:hypothetical protein